MIASDHLAINEIKREEDIRPHELAPQLGFFYVGRRHRRHCQQ